MEIKSQVKIPSLSLTYVSVTQPRWFSWPFPYNHRSQNGAAFQATQQNTRLPQRNKSCLADAAELHHWHNCQKAQSWKKLFQNPTETQSKETQI